MSTLAQKAGQIVDFGVVAYAADDLGIAVEAEIDNRDLTRLAKHAGQNIIHCTLSHSSTVKASRSNDLLLTKTKILSTSKWSGVIGVCIMREDGERQYIFNWEKEGEGEKAETILPGNAKMRIDTLRMNGKKGPIFVFDCDRTLLMTPSKKDFEAARGRPWIGSGFFDSELSLSDRLPIFPGPAMKQLQLLKRRWGNDASFVLLTGRVECLEKSVLAALSRFNVGHFDAVLMRPKTFKTHLWKGRVIRELKLFADKIVSWDDDPIAREEMGNVAFHEYHEEIKSCEGGPVDKFLASIGRTGLDEAQEAVKKVTASVSDFGKVFVRGSHRYGRVSDVDLILKLREEYLCNDEALIHIADEIAKKFGESYVARSRNPCVMLRDIAGCVDVDLTLVDNVTRTENNEEEFDGVDKGFVKTLDLLQHGLEAWGVGGSWVHGLRTHELARSLLHFGGNNWDHPLKLLREYLTKVTNTGQLPGKTGFDINSKRYRLVMRAFTGILEGIKTRRSAWDCLETLARGGKWPPESGAEIVAFKWKTWEGEKRGRFVVSCVVAKLFSEKDVALTQAPASWAVLRGFDAALGVMGSTTIKVEHIVEEIRRGADGFYLVEIFRPSVH
jgi:hypothetical protein